jgi:ATP-dependent helicase/nuclease subunit A
MTPTLELVRAGAGSGKTTDLCAIVAAAVDAGLDPSKLLATTFTRTAAAELKARMQAKLLARAVDPRQRSRDAERLELAAIGTVHSVAHQVLSRYALEMGLSPKLEVMEDDAEMRIIRELLGTMPRENWQPLVDLARRLGISGDDLDKFLLSLVSAKRGNRVGDAAFTTQLEASAERVCELLSDGNVLHRDAGDQFNALVRAALDGLESLQHDTQKNTEEARKKLRYIASGNLPKWGAHVDAGKLAAGKKSGADVCLDPLRNYAAEVCLQPGLHNDVREFTERVAAVAQWLEGSYAAHKRERGLLDFTDLELLFLDLLEQPEFRDRVAEDYHLVLVDEFQDTNPLQLAIFQRLRQLVPRSRWVGDPKQAIYGFRGTDPKMVEDLWNHAGDATRHELPKNYRSQKGLVQLVGALFGPVFGDDARQEPVRDAEPNGVERWVLKSQNAGADAKALARGVAKMGEDGFRWGDIAVLVRSNNALGPLADALADIGIPTLMEIAGLLSTREGRMALEGLRLVADRSDGVAAATLIHLWEATADATPAWISERLKVVASTRAAGASPAHPWSGDTRLSRLERIPKSLLSPTQILQEVIEALGLPEALASWGDPARRSANLDSLLRHGREYEESVRAIGLSATVGGLVLHLERLADEHEDVCYPPRGHDAVTLMTYHGSKGLEWPVVVLSELNSTKLPYLWSPVVTGGAHGGVDPLEGRAIRAWVWPFGKTDGEFPKLRQGSGLEGRALASKEGGDQTEQESREALRLLYVGCTRAKRKLVFAARDGKTAWLDALPNVNTLLDAKLPEGVHALPGIDTQLVIRQFVGDGADGQVAEADQGHGWIQVDIARETETSSTEPTARLHSPSGAPSLATHQAGELERLPGASYFPSGIKEDQHGPLGDAVHAYLAALPSLRSLTSPARLIIAERCLAAHGVTGLLPPSAVVEAGERFKNWVEQRYAGAIWRTESIGSGRRSAGGRWMGTLDLMLLLPDGRTVLVDHKSAPLRQEQCPKKALEYSGQLAAYREILLAHGRRIEAAWIHFPLAGALVRM